MQENMLDNLDDERLRLIEYNYKVIEEKISRACQTRGIARGDVTFLAATKTVEPKYINYAIGLGLSYIGENKVQELLSKYNEYNLNDCSLQFIGHLQTNKVRQIVDKVDMIQSVDSVKLAAEIGKQSLKYNKTTNVLVEVNIGKEKSKSGVMAEQTFEFIDQIRQIEGVSVKGLMTIPPICDNNSEINKNFSLMNKLFVDIQGKKMDNVNMDYLSMGMSSDYEQAILNGANMVRIGSSLFGLRYYG